MAKRVIITADDFGLSESVNEAVEIAHRQGILSTASLMIAGPAAADAVRRAKALPGLRVGLHVVVIEGASVRPSAVRSIVDGAGDFSNHQVDASVGYFFSTKKRNQVRSEIRSQFSAFARTGLRLDHANAHKHMQMHPVIGRAIIEHGRDHKLPALRIPNELPGPLQQCGVRTGLGAKALNLWAGPLRTRARRAGLETNDSVLGIAWSGHMTADRLVAVAPHLPEGLTEVYFHPGTIRDIRLTHTMPDYEHEAEFAALLDPAVREAFRAAGIRFTTYGAA